MAFERFKAKIETPIRQANSVAIVALIVALVALFVAVGNGARRGA